MERIKYGVYICRDKGYELQYLVDDLKEVEKIVNTEKDYQKMLVIEHNYRLDMDSVIGMYMSYEKRKGLRRKRNKNDKNRRK